MPHVTIPTLRGEVRGYLARPTAEGPAPGVVVIHEIWGVTDDVRRQCDWLASAGYIAVAPDLYSWGRKLACLRSTFRDLRARSGRAFADIEAARAWLAATSDCTGRIGVIGFCMGGGFALLAAPSGYAAAGVNYGEVPNDAEEILAGACPIVASFGARDRMLRGAAQRLERALTSLGIDHDVKEYPGTGHAFMNRHTAPLISAFTKVLGATYDGASAEDARQRILAFFERHLALPT